MFWYSVSSGEISTGLDTAINLKVFLSEVSSAVNVLAKVCFSLLLSRFMSIGFICI